MGLARNRASQQGLAGAWRADEQGAPWYAGAHFVELLRVAQELDLFGECGLGLVCPRHVLEGGGGRPACTFEPGSARS